MAPLVAVTSELEMVEMKTDGTIRHPDTDISLSCFTHYLVESSSILTSIQHQQLIFTIFREVASLHLHHVKSTYYNLRVYSVWECKQVNKIFTLPCY